MMAIRRRKIQKKPTASILDVEVSAPAENLNQYIIWLYGAPGIGKSSLAKGFGRTFHFMFGDRDASSRIKKAQITNWEVFEKTTEEWCDRLDFDTAVIDVVDEAYELCFDYMCSDGRLVDPWGNPVEHPNDANDMGKSWKKIKRAFMRPLLRLAADPTKGLVLISHGKQSTRKTAEGDEVEDVHPAISGQGLEFLTGLSDVLGYYHIRGGQRMLQIQPSAGIVAKCRPEENFRHTDGTAVKRIPMGDNPVEAFANFEKAFQNGLEPPQVRKKPVRRNKKKTVKRTIKK